MCLIEACHYPPYQYPTNAEQISVEILGSLLRLRDATLILLDDVTPLHRLPRWRRNLRRVPIDFHPNFIEHESKLDAPGLEVLSMLQIKGLAEFHAEAWYQEQLDRGYNDICIQGGWFFENIRLTTSAGTPTVVLRDAGLTLKKHRYGFTHLINILHEDFGNEQHKLKRLVAAAMPEITLEVILYNLLGQNWPLENTK